MTARKLVTIRRIDAVKTVADYEVLVIDGIDVEEFHSERDVFHAGEYCVFVERGVSLPAHPTRPWKATARTETVQLYPMNAFPEIMNAMMMLSDDHDGFSGDDYAQVRANDFARSLGVEEAG
jgi:hypothetical protein